MLHEFACHPCIGTIQIYEFKMNLFGASVAIPTDSRGSQQSGVLDESPKKKICSIFDVPIPFESLLPWALAARIHLYPGWHTVKSDQPNSTEILSCSCAFIWQLHLKCIFISINSIIDWTLFATLSNLVQRNFLSYTLWVKCNCLVSFTQGNILIILLWFFVMPSWMMALKDIPSRDVHFSLS